MDDSDRDAGKKDLNAQGKAHQMTVGVLIIELCLSHKQTCWASNITWALR